MGDWTLYWVIFFFVFLLTCWSFSRFTSLIFTLVGPSGEVDFPKISARYLNDSLCAFPSVTSGLKGGGFCSA